MQVALRCYLSDEARRDMTVGQSVKVVLDEEVLNVHR